MLQTSIESSSYFLYFQYLVPYWIADMFCRDTIHHHQTFFSCKEFSPFVVTEIDTWQILFLSFHFTRKRSILNWPRYTTFANLYFCNHCRFSLFITILFLYSQFISNRSNIILNSYVHINRHPNNHPLASHIICFTVHPWWWLPVSISLPTTLVGIWYGEIMATILWHSWYKKFYY